MNIPSIELCKKLKEAGYTQYEVTYVYDEKWQLRHISECIWFWLPDAHWIAPTVMELIDSLPWKIEKNGKLYLFIDKKSVSYMGDCDCWGYYTVDEFYIKTDTLPNALAEMRLLLKEKGFIN